MRLIAIMLTGFLIGILVPGDIRDLGWWIIAGPLCILNVIFWEYMEK